MDLSQLPLFKDVDVIQIGARNMQNFDLLKAVGHQDKPVMIKRGMSATLRVAQSAEYVMAGGNENVSSASGASAPSRATPATRWTWPPSPCCAS
jgi:3-deoxy-D-arabino-heptulosonate 7-phosphate (DAHP) synthase